MKIALFTDGIYPYVIGGMQKHSFYLAKFLAKEGIYVDLYHTNNSIHDVEKLAFFTEAEKKYITSIVVDFPAGNKLPGHYIRSSFDYSERIFEIFKQNDKVDFVYAKGFTAWKLLKEKEKGYACAPVGVNFHGFEMFQKAPDLLTWLKLKALLSRPVVYNVRKADYLFSYGGRITEIIKRIAGDRSTIMEIPSGIEKEWLNTQVRKPEKPLKLLFIGRFERRKGIEELNKALKQLSNNEHFQMTFIGPIPEYRHLKLPNIFYMGEISEQQLVKKIMRENDVLICPSYSEGMPNVILEAMASGMAIIASDVGGVSELVNQDNGILIHPGSVKSLVAALNAFLDKNSDEIYTMKKKSIAKIEKDFLWERIILTTITELKCRIKQFPKI